MSAKPAQLLIISRGGVCRFLQLCMWLTANDLTQSQLKLKLSSNENLLKIIHSPGYKKSFKPQNLYCSKWDWHYKIVT